jgi:hypothetical protein
VRRTNAVCRLPVLLKAWSCCFLLFCVELNAQSADDPLPRLRQPALAVQAHPATLQSRWDRFEAEFGLPEEQTSLLASSILHAKYGVDLAAFGVKAISNTLQDATEFRFSRGRVRRASSAELDPSPRYAHPTGPFSLEDARLKFDFVLATGKPYVGARLVIPFGN